MGQSCPFHTTWSQSDLKHIILHYCIILHNASMYRHRFNTSSINFNTLLTWKSYTANRPSPSLNPKTSSRREATSANPRGNKTHANPPAAPVQPAVPCSADPIDLLPAPPKSSGETIERGNSEHVTPILCLKAVLKR